MAPDPRRPFPVGRRGVVLFAIAAAGAWAWFALGVSFADLLPSPGGWVVVGEFFSCALSPSLSLVGPALEASRKTLVFAAAAMSLSLLFGVVLGFPASTAWWAGDLAGAPGPLARIVRRAVAPAVYFAARAAIAFMRSVHELLWAVLFLAAFGFNTFAAVLAISIPFGGTLAKIFSEMIDEAPRDSAVALRAAGASPLQVFCFGLLPRALPDMCAYAFYRFECAVRSSAILGFFGYETLGYHIRADFESLRYSAVWTHLYALFLLVVLLDAWSGAVRRRFVAYE